MRALVMTGSAATDTLDIREVPEVTPDRGEIAVDVEYAGVNFADAMVRRGDHAYGAGWPYVPGLEVVGTVNTVGPDVVGFETEQRVTAYTYGRGFAETAIAAAMFAVRLPDHVDSAQAAAVPVTLSTAHLLICDAVRMRRGDRVLVHSASGGMGIAIGLVARRYEPALLVGTVSTAAKTSIAASQGYDAVVVRDDGWVGEARRLSQGRDYSVVLSAMGTELLAEDLALTAPGGKILRYGNVSGLQHAPLPPLATLNNGNVAIGGFSRRALARADPGRVSEALREAVALMAAGVTIPVTVSDGLEAVPALLEAMLQGRTVGKQVVRIKRAT